MSENPYAQYPAERRHEFGDEPQRMSWMAVLSLIFAIICCIPGFGVVALILGISALMAIGRSGGRLGGKALAVIGVVLGMLATVGWIVLGIGGSQVWNAYTTQIIGGTSEIIETMEADDVGAFRAHLLDTAAADVTDEEIRMFFAAVEHEYGDFVRTPKTLSEMLEAFGEAYGAQGVAGGGGGGGQQSPPIPVPVEFTNGKTVVHIIVDDDSFATSKLRIEDMYIVMKNRKALTLRKDGPAANGAVSQSFDPIHASDLPPEKLLPPSPGGADTDTDTDQDSEAEEPAAEPEAEPAPSR